MNKWNCLASLCLLLGTGALADPLTVSYSGIDARNSFKAMADVQVSSNERACKIGLQVTCCINNSSLESDVCWFSLKSGFGYYDLESPELDRTLTRESEPTTFQVSIYKLPNGRFSMNSNARLARDVGRRDSGVEIEFSPAKPNPLDSVFDDWARSNSCKLKSRYPSYDGPASVSCSSNQPVSLHAAYLMRLNSDGKIARLGRQFSF
jgi:hypothetical protein